MPRSSFHRQYTSGPFPTLSHSVSQSHRQVSGFHSPRNPQTHASSPFSHGCLSILQARQKVRFSSHPRRSYTLSIQIDAIGRDYLNHIKELNNPIPKVPFFFLKPTSSYLLSQTPGARVDIPRGILVHREVRIYLIVPLFTLFYEYRCRTWPHDRGGAVSL